MTTHSLVRLCNMIFDNFIFLSSMNYCHIGWFGKTLWVLLQLTISLDRSDWTIKFSANFWLFLPCIMGWFGHPFELLLQLTHVWSDWAIWFSDNFVLCYSWIMGWFGHTFGLLLQLTKYLVRLGKIIFW